MTSNTDPKGKTALMHAIIEGKTKEAENLIQTEKSNLGHVDNEGNTALIYAIFYDIFDKEIAKKLIDTKESNPGHVDNEGRTALIHAIFENNTEIAKKLIATGKSNPGHVDNEGRTALVYAIFEKNTEIAEKLIDTGESNAGHVDQEGKTALVYACKTPKFNPEIISLLIHPEGKPECINKKGGGALSILYDDYEYYKNKNESDKQKIILPVLVKLIHYFYSNYFTEKKLPKYIDGSTVVDITTVIKHPVTEIERIQVHYQLLQKICSEQKDNNELKQGLYSKGVKFESFCAIPTTDIKEVKKNLPVGTRMEKSNSNLNKSDDADEIVNAKNYPEDIVDYHVKDIKGKIEKGEIVLKKDPKKPEIQTLTDYLIKLNTKGITEEEIKRIHRSVHGAVDMTQTGNVGFQIPKQPTNIGGKRRTVRRKKTVHPRRKTTRRIRSMKMVR